MFCYWRGLCSSTYISHEQCENHPTSEPVFSDSLSCQVLYKSKIHCCLTRKVLKADTYDPSVFNIAACCTTATKKIAETTECRCKSSAPLLRLKVASRILISCMIYQSFSETEKGCVLNYDILENMLEIILEPAWNWCFDFMRLLTRVWFSPQSLRSCGFTKMTVRPKQGAFRNMTIQTKMDDSIQIQLARPLTCS